MAEYWIWSNEHGAWWRSAWRGYTPNLHEAGRYAEAEANKILERANYVVPDHDFPNEVAIPVTNGYLSRLAQRVLKEFENEAETLKDWTPQNVTSTDYEHGWHST